jgi:lipoprotein-releasing system ATP-binding protein
MLREGDSRVGQGRCSNGVGGGAVADPLTRGPALSVRGLHKSYPSGAGRIQVLSGLDLDVPAGKVIAILGASGSGKSTLLHQVGALDRPDAGEIRYGELEITHLGEDERAMLRNRYVGFIFQYHHLLAEFSALENVSLPLLLGGKGEEEARARASQLLEIVGLQARRDHTPSRLSGGEQQRVALARALANDPLLVLADEPTGNLDRATGEALYELLYSVARSGQQSWLVATHNEYLARLADIRLRLEDGRLQPAD